MIDFSQILNVVIILAVVAGLTSLFYYSYSNENFRAKLKKFLPFLPTALSLLANRVEDKKGVFDTHDALKVLERISVRIKETISDPTNANFEDVQEEVYAMVREELDLYKRAGVKGVPEVSDETLRVQVRVVFDTIKRTLSEDPTGDDRQD